MTTHDHALDPQTLASRQQLRHALFRACFEQISKEYREPRAARRRIARALAKKAVRQLRATGEVRV